MTENNCKDVKYSPCGFAAKALSPVRPHEPRRAVGWVLDVWASGVHFQADSRGKESAGGTGDPEWRAIFSEPPPVPPLGPTVPACDRSDEMYDASVWKYDQRPKSDLRVVSCSELVEIAKAGMPLVVTAYLLYAYPRNGKYAPQYRGLAWSEEPVRGFIDRGFCLSVPGFEGSDSDVARFRKWLLRREREVKDSLRKQIASRTFAGKNSLEVATSVLRSSY